VVWRSCAQRQKLRDVLEEELCAIEQEIRNAEVQLNNVKQHKVHTMSDLVGKVERRA
jgi:hypothetical protein